jgi:hypothetical protein
MRLAEAAQKRFDNVAKGMEGVHCVMWMDNFFRRTSSHHPGRRGSAGLNTTVVSILHTGALPPFRRFVDVHRWDEGIRIASRQVEKFSDRMKEMIKEVRRTVWSDANLRVPLDFHREGVRPLQWTALALMDDVVGSNAGLLAMVRFALKCAEASAAPLPLLVDINIHYRLLRLMFNRAYVPWDAMGALCKVPPLFGMWHAYKQACVTVRREFFSIFAYLERGKVTGWTPGSAKLRNSELLIAALLMLPPDYKDFLRAFVTIAQRDLRRLLPEINLDSREARRRFCKTAVRDGVADEGEVTRLLCRVVVAEGLVDLLDFFAPCCFIMGYLVRSCHWDGRDRGTGERAWDITAIALHVLRSCAGEKAKNNEYYRSLTLLMSMWTTWYGELPSCCYSEEICEAGLSRLSKMLGDHLQWQTVTDAMNLYLLLDPAVPGPRKTSGQKVGSNFLAAMKERLAALVGSRELLMSWLPWTAAVRLSPGTWTCDWDS